MDQQTKTDTDALYKASLVFSFLVGIAFRTYHLFMVGFSVPFNLGGLFYQMSLEILRNGFRLPASIPYYFPGGLPFAYPPLPFYLQAFVIDVIAPGNFFAVNALPPFFSILSLFAFYFLARKVINQKAGVAGAVFAFAIHPAAFLEQIEGMGLAEAPGTLALILYLLSLAWAADKAQKRRWMSAGVCLGLCILSSPGSIYASILISLMFLAVSIWHVIVRKDAGLLIGCCIIGVTGLMVSAPYWGTVIARHGSGIFLNAFSAQNSGLLQQFAARALDLQLIHASPFWNILFLFGLLAAFIKKQYLLILFSAVLMLMPREYWILSIPASLLSGYATIWLLELLQFISKDSRNYLKVGMLWTMALFFMVDSGTNLAALINDDAYDISAVQIDELIMIKKSNLVPADQYVLILGNWGLIEWSPALLERTVINNPFGLEWQPDASERIRLLNEILLRDAEPDAILAAARETASGMDGIYLIADRERFNQLEKTHGGKDAVYETLREFGELAVGWLTTQN